MPADRVVFIAVARIQGRVTSEMSSPQTSLVDPQYAVVLTQRAPLLVSAADGRVGRSRSAARP